MGDRDAAPGDLGILQAFVNTADLEDGTDEIASADALRSWLSAHGPALEGPVRPSDVAEARRVREAMRTLLGANNGERVDPEASAALETAAERARIRLRFDPRTGRSRLEPTAGGVAGALGRLLVIADSAMAEGTWQRLKVCRDDACRWAFYDASRNRSGVWCAMAVCGNREKVRSYRTRRRATGANAPPS